MHILVVLEDATLPYLNIPSLWRKEIISQADLNRIIINIYSYPNYQYDLFSNKVSSDTIEVKDLKFLEMLCCEFKSKITFSFDHFTSLELFSFYNIHFLLSDHSDGRVNRLMPQMLNSRESILLYCFLYLLTAVVPYNLIKRIITRISLMTADNVSIAHFLYKLHALQRFQELKPIKDITLTVNEILELLRYRYNSTTSSQLNNVFSINFQILLMLNDTTVTPKKCQNYEIIKFFEKLEGISERHIKMIKNALNSMNVQHNDQDIDEIALLYQKVVIKPPTIRFYKKKNIRSMISSALYLMIVVILMLTHPYLTTTGYIIIMNYVIIRNAPTRTVLIIISEIIIVIALLVYLIFFAF